MRPRIFLLALCPLALTSVAFAQGDDGEGPATETPEVIAKLFDCRGIADPDERLICYDREVNSVYTAQASKDLVIADREPVKETKKGLFGFSLPKLWIFGGDDDKDRSA